MEEIRKEKTELKDLYPTICAVIAAGGEFMLYPNGKSMLPTIRPGKDAVLLSAPQDLQAGDMILYRRKNGAFVLHRIVRIEADGTYTLRGDNQYYDEHGILHEQVIAKVDSFYRGKKKIFCTSRRHRFYLWRRRVSYPLRNFSFRVCRKLKSIFKK